MTVRGGLFRREQALFYELEGDLHGIGGGALAYVVAHAPEVDAVRDAGVAAQSVALSMAGAIAVALSMTWHVAS